MKYQIRVAAFVAMSFIVSVLSSCSKNDDKDTTPPDNKPKKTAVMLTTSATFGKVLTDSLGKSLYFFSLDADGKSACSGACVTAWPVFYAADLTLDSTLTAADFAVITRADGSKQNTYKGWPLYYYAGDAKAGDITGDKVQDIWYVAKPDYTVMIAKFQLTGNKGTQYKSDLTPGVEATQFITDAYGRTLYAFAPDKNGKNTYTKEDFSNNATWPIYELADITNVPSIVSKSDFTKVTVFTKTQLAYKGWPLYYFGPDAQIRGNTKGVDVPSPGVWPYVNSSTSVAPAQ